MVYAEVLNVLKRLDADTFLMQEVKKLLSEKKILKYGHHNSFWFEKVEFYMKRVKLRTQDLIILSSVFEQWPCEFITGDKKLNDSYNSLKNLHEKNKFSI